jgi:hypothetical protein
MTINNSNGITTALAKIGDGNGGLSPLAVSDTKVAINDLVWPTAGAATGKILAVSSTSNQLEWITLPASQVLTAGTNITIANNVISATVPTYTAGTNVSITNNVISATVPTYTAGTGVSITNNVISATAPTIPYDIASAILGKPAGAAVVMRFVAVRAFTIAAGATGSVAKAATVATASTTFSLQKNGTQFGTMVFAAGAAAGTFTVASTTSFAAGDIMTIVAPSSADATFGDCEFTIVATL